MARAPGLTTRAQPQPGDGGDTRARLGRLDELTGYHLRRAAGVFSSAFARAAAATPIRQVPFAILSVVGANPGIRQGAAGSALGIQRANMVALINELVDGGFVERRAAEDDRRAFALMLTADGQAMLDRLTTEILAQEAALVALYSPAECDALIALLRRIEAREPPVD